MKKHSKEILRPWLHGYNAITTIIINGPDTSSRRHNNKPLWKFQTSDLSSDSSIRIVSIPFSTDFTNQLDFDS